MTEGRQQQISKHISKKLTDEDMELYELTRLSGVTIDPHVFHILLELLRLDVSPIALFDVLQDMSMQFQKSLAAAKKYSDSKSTTTHTSSSGRKKPPVAAKPKKIRSSNIENKPNIKST